MTKALADCGLDPSRVRTEPFGSAGSINPGVIQTDRPAPHTPATPSGVPAGPTVSFARSSITTPWSTSYGTLLDLAEACDVPVKWSCRSGVCHTCESSLLQGQVDYSPEPLDPPQAGNVLICCSQPAADIVLDL
ncbi:2Fe-2S iron-sulfur cluster-binding protein [Streptomyces sp. NPDC005227]|uniref:2Fe-2S iron-sulfur cluster-binding protein n=1 Tax=Streptomyces sp. NPDC005227 TaxID=3364707 RepID=UPI00369D67AA